MNPKLLDLYTDYLISSFSYTTATGLSRLTDSKVSHDKITRFLREEDLGSRQLWKAVKPLVRNIESPEGCLIVDDTIQRRNHIRTCQKLSSGILTIQKAEMSRESAL